MAQNGRNQPQSKLSGQIIINELVRNMEIGQFEMGYSVLLPCIFSVYLHPEDHARVAAVRDLIEEDAKQALSARLAQMNEKPPLFAVKRRGKAQKQYKIARQDWSIEFIPDSEGTVPLGDVEIHSELNDVPQPGYHGTKTTLIGREPSVTAERPDGPREATRRSSEPVFAEIRYQDDSGPQIYFVSQNEISVGRGGPDLLVDLPLYANDEVSREHLRLRRDPVNGRFSIVDKSMNGTWIDGRRLARGVEEVLPDRADIGIAEVLTLSFEVKK